jgi:hypothetical protein
MIKLFEFPRVVTVIVVLRTQPVREIPSANVGDTSLLASCTVFGAEAVE